MPNWCNTNIIISGKSKKEECDFYQNLIMWVKEPCIENGFGTNWLGNVVERSGIAKWDVLIGDFIPTVKCRGCILNLNIDNSGISLQTETAWVPMIKMWKDICDKYFPSGYDIVYWAEEPGCDVYETNDYMYENSYVFDNQIESYDDDDCFNEEELTLMKKYESMHSCSEDELVDILSEMLNTDEKDINKLLELFNESKFSDVVFITKWNFVYIENVE